MRWLSLIPVILISIHTYCQELSYRQYTVKDGLPGSTVYQALEDRKGFIWFATNQGISRFDGRTFTNYYKEDGLPDNDIIKLYLDQYDNIWLISFIGIPAVLHEGVITAFPDCKHVLSVCEDPLTHSIALITTFGTGKIHYWGSYISEQAPGQWRFIPCIKESPMVPADVRTVRASTSGKTGFYFSIADAKNYALTIQTGATVKKHFFERKGPFASLPFSVYDFAYCTENRKGIVFYTDDFAVYYADTQRIRMIMPSGKKGRGPAVKDINSLYCENDSTLWICSRDRGLLYIKDFLGPHPAVHSFFNERFCTSLIKDRENGYWLTTHGDGVYYLPNLCFFSLSGYSELMGKNALCIRSIGGNNLVAGFADGNVVQINCIDISSKCFPKWALQNKNNRIMDIWPFRGDTLVAATDRGMRMLSPHGSTIVWPASMKELHVLPGRSILAGTFSDVLLLNNAGIKMLSTDRASCVTHLNGQYFWGTLHGAYTYANNTMCSLGLQHPELSGIINHLDIAPDSSLWASTQQGIVILKNNRITCIKKEQGLPGNMCKHVSFEHHAAWISTDKGIARIDYQWNNNRLSYSLSNITEEDGLTTNNVNRTLPAGNYIWAVTERGISFFSKDYISHSVRSPRININRILVGDEPAPVSDTLQIDYRKRKLLIELSGISYRSGRQIYYEYRLLGLDSNWSRVSNSPIEFPALPFGRFVFEVRSVDRWGKRSDAPKRILIMNAAPFWETTWFRLLSYIVLGLLSGVVFYIWHRGRQRKKEQEYQLKNKMHHLEMMALRAQMNPHFIFNCLTSIQYHVIRSDARKANYYLHKFSTLIRQILQHSTDSFISLREEIKILELYLELEKLRLGDRMEYRVLVPDELKEENHTVPVMIVQPYVENAIKHGIGRLENRQGLLTITISRTGPYIEFFIEDNGPGIYSLPSAGDGHTPDHMPMGAGITAHRISTINETQKQKVLLQITDKRKSGHTGTGTIVHLSFPIITK